MKTANIEVKYKVTPLFKFSTSGKLIFKPELLSRRHSEYDTSDKEIDLTFLYYDKSSAYEDVLVLEDISASILLNLYTSSDIYSSISRILYDYNKGTTFSVPYSKIYEFSFKDIANDENNYICKVKIDKRSMSQFALTNYAEEYNLELKDKLYDLNSYFDKIPICPSEYKSFRIEIESIKIKDDDAE